MSGPGTIGKQLLIVGAFIAFVGLVLILLERVPSLRIGRLPGDIWVEREGWSFYFPLATSIVLSVIISLILWLVRRKINR